MRLVLFGYPTWADMDKVQLNEWLNRLAETYGKRIGKLQYTFLPNDEIIRINQQYLNHNYATDIITFEYNEDDVVSGEVFVGVDTVIENAKILGLSETDELDRVISHGFLHLIGFKDKIAEDKRAMRAAEDKCLLLRSKKLINK